MLPQEIFPQRDNNQVVLNEPLFDIAYFPTERGQYNYNAAFSALQPEQNWGGITRAITNEVNFEATNVQYLEFWLMDPFISGERGIVKDGIFNQNNTTGGDLVFNLGSISEDLAPDDRHAFENGLPTSGEVTDDEISAWGQITTEPYLTNFFANTPGARDFQDVGLDGLRDEDEGRIPGNPFGGEDDPSADNFVYILDESYDAVNAKIVQRYKNWNGMENNSPISTGNSNQNFIPASTTFPDNEDLNNDNTVTNLEEYFEYRIPLRPGELRAGEEFIVDEITSSEGATWYLYRIPIMDVGTPIGTPSFENIKYIRTYLTGFRQPVVLRFAQMQLVGSQWIKSEKSLVEEGLNEIPNTSSSDFQVFCSKCRRKQHREWWISLCIATRLRS